MTRHPLVSILMAVVGILMLLPGACVILMINVLGWPRGGDDQIVGLWTLCLAISALGIFLIVKAFR